MADILTLAEARAALNWAEGQNINRDGELEDVYIPTVTSMVIAHCGTLSDPTPGPVVHAAGIILAHLWNADKQGRADASAVRGEDAGHPVGFAIPRRAEVLLAPYANPTSFAFA